MVSTVMLRVACFRNVDSEVRGNKSRLERSHLDSIRVGLPHMKLRPRISMGTGVITASKAHRNFTEFAWRFFRAVALPFCVRCILILSRTRLISGVCASTQYNHYTKYEDPNSGHSRGSANECCSKSMNFTLEVKIASVCAEITLYRE